MEGDCALHPRLLLFTLSGTWSCIGGAMRLRTLLATLPPDFQLVQALYDHSVCCQHKFSIPTPPRQRRSYRGTAPMADTGRFVLPQCKTHSICHSRVLPPQICSTACPPLVYHSIFATFPFRAPDQTHVCAAVVGAHNQLFNFKHLWDRQVASSVLFRLLARAGGKRHVCAAVVGAHNQLFNFWWKVLGMDGPSSASSRWDASQVASPFRSRS